MSFQQGLSGLNSSAKNLDSIGNNVANASTVGFKQSQTQFADAYAASLSGGGSLQTGSGSRVAAVAQQFSQGNISTTNNPLDIAISGAGFFRMTDPTGNVFYSRNGQFHEDKDGFIVNSLGHNVTGYEATLGTIAAVQPPVKLQISTTDKSNPPKATGEAGVAVNLVSTALGISTAFDATISTTYNSSTALAVYDAAGASHVTSLYFQRIPLTTVTATAVALFGAGVAPATKATVSPVAVAAGLTIGNNITIAGASTDVGGIHQATITAIDGTLITFTPPTTLTNAGAANFTADAGSNSWNVFLTVDGIVTPCVPPLAAPAPATAMQVLTFANGILTPAPEKANVNPTLSGVATPIKIDLAQCTQYAGTFNVNSMTQNGYAKGDLSGYSTGADGTILGRYTNGQTKALGQMLLNNFSNPGGLQPVGNNEWIDTVTAGNLGPFTPGKSSTGVLQSSAVEDSNVDLTAELVSMIVAQRMYQANAQTIKAQDQILQTIVNLK